MSLRRGVSAALAALLLAAPRAAAGQDPPGQDAKAAAQVLFDEAMALRKRGAHAEACAKLDESLRLDHAPGTKFYLAECLEQTNRLASAWTLYTEVADEMATTGQSKREAYARERSAALAARVARLSIVVPTAARVPGMVVKRDSLVVGEAQWGVAIPVDFGTHTIEVTAPGRKAFTRTVDLREPGATTTVVLPVWTSSTSPTTSIPTLPPPAEPRPAPGFPPLRAAGLALGGFGLAGLTVGAVLGGLAVAKRDESNAGPCDAARDVCSPDGLALRAVAVTAATGSTVAFVASGVVLATSVTLLVLPATGAARAAVVVRPDSLAVEGRW